MAQAEILPEPLAGLREHPRWLEVRERIVRLIYGPGLSADLVDLYTAAALNKWIHVDQVCKWKRAACGKVDLYEDSKGRAGKAKLWEVLRPPLEEVYVANGLELPSCRPNRRESPPPPADLQGFPPEVAAARSVKV